jgi:hypothetical protein
LFFKHEDSIKRAAFYSKYPLIPCNSVHYLKGNAEISHLPLTQTPFAAPLAFILAHSLRSFDVQTL